MLQRFAPVVALCAAVATMVASPPVAEACGGCFVSPSQTTVVTGHRMAISISTTQSVLWDQIQYSGDPNEFSWVLPIKKGARIEVANDAFFEALDAGTAVTVQAPPEGCAPQGGGFGCSDQSFAVPMMADGANGTGVTVVHQGTVGPYETVTLSAEDPNALNDWLEQHGYNVPKAVQPTIDAYVSEGFDFIALRLQPGKGVAQMTPVRVVSPGAVYSLPLRMVAAGVGAKVSIILFVIGEGRYAAKNFGNATIPADLVSWDFSRNRSDYSGLRAAALDANSGRNWLSAYARQGALLSSMSDPIGFSGFVPYSVNNTTVDTLAKAYVEQAIANGSKVSDKDCLDNFDLFASSKKAVKNPCDAEGENCTTLPSGETDARLFACGELDDVAVALTGMHPADVTLTRLEANLPVAALDADLLLEAAKSQETVHNRFIAGLKLHACGEDDAESLVGPMVGNGERPGPLSPEALILLSLGAAGLLLAQRRRRAPNPA